MSLVRPSVPRSADPIDRVFQELTSGWFGAPRTTASPGQTQGQPQVRMRHVDDGVEFVVDLPGVPRDAITVEVSERAMSVAVQHSDEFDTLSWSHKVTLGGSLDPEGVTARHVDGRLTIHVPRTPQAPARRIELG